MNKTMEEIRIIQTPHYSFDLKIKEKWDPYHKFIILVGNNKYPCLEANIIMPDINERMKTFAMVDVVKINQIDALMECSRESITNEYMEKHSFGEELMLFLIDYIRTTFPHVKKLSLNDSSYIPCNRASGDTLDLLTYSIALYGKTWYEKKFGAYLKNKERYKSDIIKYMGKDFKNNTKLDDILILITKNNNFAEDIIYKNIDIYNEIYDKSETLPEFFIKISKNIARKDKCRFFKTWLEEFIKKNIFVEKEWFINLDTIVGGNKKRANTRKNKSKKI